MLPSLFINNNSKMVPFILILIMSNVHFAVNLQCGCNVGRNEKFTFNKNIAETCPSIARNEESAESKTLEDMILVPSGIYQLGTDDIAIPGDVEGPKKLLNLNGFYLDRHEVSNEKFMKFVQSTGYKTEAEVFGDSFVFSLFMNNSYKEELRDFRVMQAVWWYKVPFANWQHPYGPDSDIKDTMNHPVIHVSWRDARAYCSWQGGRLPTEAEWEAACRAGQQDTAYPWGDKLLPDKKHMANIWQGTFPNYNSAKDGFVGTSPVDSFLQNELGLFNIAGNVWEWVQDDWSEKSTEKVKKGGSYLCHRSYCYRYRCSSRSHNTEDSSAGNLGFRCAKDA